MNANIEVEAETLIRAPRPLVFEIAADVARWPDIIGGIDRIGIETPGPIGAGTRFRETRRMYGREATETMTFASYEPPQQFTLIAENHGARYRAVYLFRDAKAGTLLRVQFTGEPVTLLARIFSLLAVLMKGHVRSQIAADLQDLKRAAESR